MLPNAKFFNCCALRFVSTPLPPRCWVKAETLPLETGASLTAAHGKVPRDGFKGPAVEGLKKTLKHVSVRVRQADEQGSPVTDTE